MGKAGEIDTAVRPLRQCGAVCDVAGMIYIDTREMRKRRRHHPAMYDPRDAQTARSLAVCISTNGSPAFPLASSSHLLVSPNLFSVRVCVCDVICVGEPLAPVWAPNYIIKLEMRDKTYRIARSASQCRSLTSSRKNNSVAI